MRLLHIDSAITGRQSISRQLTASIVARLTAPTSGVEVVYRDLASAPLPHHSEAILARKAPAQADGDPMSNSVPPSSDLVRDVAVLDAALAEFLAAHVVVIGAPMYNFSIPSQLKSWIDAITVAGKSFSYSAEGAIGLCGGKRIIVASSRGGVYTGSSPMASLDYQEGYLRGIFSFLGVTDLSFVRAEGISYGLDYRQSALESALAEVALLKAS